ncbi:SET domain-containing protein-lysine N-methyltransferase [Candidatus Woesearchaeota archaeon]|nr:SET domain-containing protein-lysine N-methyltransferase [Candidatus Woesearchaeota archaeon]
MLDLCLGNSKNGKGVFANKNFKRGDSILQFEGKILDDNDIEIDTYEDEYCIQIGKRAYLGPSGKLDDFVNHSCSPNCGIKKTKEKLLLVALRTIKKSEELAFDYSTWADYSTSMKGHLWKMHCNCGSKNCRRIIKDFRYLPAALKKKYIKSGIVPNYILENLRKL